MGDDREREVQPAAPAPPEAGVGRAAEVGPGVIEGDDDIPRQPAPQRDPFVPEPGPRPGERRAWRVMRLSWIAVLLVVAIVVYAAFR
jgi:hypothetical protein